MENICIVLKQVKQNNNKIYQDMFILMTMIINKQIHQYNKQIIMLNGQKKQKIQVNKQ